VVVDTNNDFTAAYIMAGDLQGNLWKFDVRDTSPSNWRVAYSNAGKPAPLFTAKDNNDTPQPITSRPEVIHHLEGRDGLMVFFGTGKYIETTDPENHDTQTVYGIWDNGAPVSGRGVLQAQSLVSETTVNGNHVRLTTANSITWDTQQGWYFDFPALGERAVSNPLLRNGRLILTTLIPNTGACSSGSPSWLMEFDANSGGRLNFPPFDLDGDKKFTDSDQVSISNGNSSELAAPSGLQSKQGILFTPAIFETGGLEYKFSSGSGAMSVIVANPGPGLGLLGWEQALP